jgi:hypothetical protein
MCNYLLANWPFTSDACQITSPPIPRQICHVMQVRPHHFCFLIGCTFIGCAGNRLTTFDGPPSVSINNPSAGCSSTLDIEDACWKSTSSAFVEAPPDVVFPVITNLLSMPSTHWDCQSLDVDHSESSAGKDRWGVGTVVLASSKHTNLMMRIVDWQPPYVFTADVSQSASKWWLPRNAARRRVHAELKPSEGGGTDLIVSESERPYPKPITVSALAKLAQIALNQKVDACLRGLGGHRVEAVDGAQ